jgi:ABC-type sugar transport system ATPase subunit
MPQPTADTPDLVTIQGACKSFGTTQALRDVSFEIAPGEILGLCGHNGAGKSTLVKALVGLVQLDSGEMRVGGRPVTLRGTQDAQRAGIAVVDQELSVIPELTVAENIFLGDVDQGLVLRRAERRRRAAELLGTLGMDHIDPGEDVERLEIGERQLVEIARLLARKARVLILDEPTSTLSSAEIDRVFAAVRSVAKSGAGVILVSHRLEEVLGVCHRVTVLRDGRNVGSRPTDDLTKHELVEMMLGEQPEIERPELAARRRSSQSVAPGGGLHVRDLRVGTRVGGFDLDVAPGEIVGLAGQVGSGASDVLAALAGLSPDVGGSILVGDRPLPPGRPWAANEAGVRYVSNDRKGQGLFLERSCQRNLIITRLPALSVAGTLPGRRIRPAAAELASKVGVDRDRLPKAVRTLSGGNQQKVLIGRCLGSDGLRVLVLDDPTRGVDVGGRADIHRLVREAAADGAAVIFASTELDELLELSDLVVTMYAGRVVSRLGHDDASQSRVLSDMTHQNGDAQAVA